MSLLLCPQTHPDVSKFPIPLLEPTRSHGLPATMASIPLPVSQSKSLKLVFLSGMWSQIQEELFGSWLECLGDAV